MRCGARRPAARCPGIVEAAANKVVHTPACQEIARAALDFGGPEALVRGAREAALAPEPVETIGGGTSEVMRGDRASRPSGSQGRS
jgi:hypothetical protein